MNMKQIVSGVILTKACSISPDKDSEESKTIHLRVKFDGVTLGDVFAKAVSGAVISWQNGPGRKKFDTWENGQSVEIEFKSPGKATVDPIDAIVAGAKAAGMSVEEYLRAEMAKRQ